MKETIVRAARKCLDESNGKKLTIKDIVKECDITRQTFYYHFRDISDMAQWIIEREAEKFIQEASGQNDPEKIIKSFFIATIDGMPYVKKAFKTNYQDEIHAIIENEACLLFERLMKRNAAYSGLKNHERVMFMRYHICAITGILNEWTEEDSENIDEIVHQIYLMIRGGLKEF